MDRRALLAAVAVGFTAGCSRERLPGGFGEPTATPPADSEWTTENGLDVSALVEAHVTALTEAGSYTLTSTAAAEHEGDQTPNFWLENQTIETKFDGGRDRRLLTQEWPDTNEELQVYTTLDRAFLREQIDDRVRFSVQQSERTRGEYEAVFQRRAPSGMADLADWAIEYASPDSSGEQPRFTYEGESFDGSRDIPDTIEESTLTATVTEAGVVRQLAKRFDGSHEDLSATVETDFSYDEIGSTDIPEPDWLQQAREATDES